MTTSALVMICTFALVFVALGRRGTAQNTVSRANEPTLSSKIDTEICHPGSSARSEIIRPVHRVSAGKCFSKQGVTKSTKPRVSIHNGVKAVDEPKFRWFDVKGLKFDSWDAPDVHSFSALNSIAEEGVFEEREKLESPRDRFLPDYKGHLKEISIDDKTFRWGKLFAKPDAVFYDESKDEYLVVEYKNREFHCLASLTPLNVLQLLVSAEVVRKHIELRSGKGYNVKVKAFMRLNNKLTRITGWEVLSQRALSFLPEALDAHKLTNISATLMARTFVLFDPVFKFKPQNNKDACVLGSIKHARMSLRTERCAA